MSNTFKAIDEIQTMLTSVHAISNKTEVLQRNVASFRNAELSADVFYRDAVSDMDCIMQNAKQTLSVVFDWLKTTATHKNGSSEILAAAVEERVAKSRHRGGVRSTPAQLEKCVAEQKKRKDEEAAAAVAVAAEKKHAAAEKKKKEQAAAEKKKKEQAAAAAAAADARARSEQAEVEAEERARVEAAAKAKIAAEKKKKRRLNEAERRRKKREADRERRAREKEPEDADTAEAPAKEASPAKKPPKLPSKPSKAQSNGHADADSDKLRAWRTMYVAPCSVLDFITGEHEERTHVPADDADCFSSKRVYESHVKACPACKLLRESWTDTANGKDDEVWPYDVLSMADVVAAVKRSHGDDEQASAVVAAYADELATRFKNKTHLKHADVVEWRKKLQNDGAISGKKRAAPAAPEKKARAPTPAHDSMDESNDYDGDASFSMHASDDEIVIETEMRDDEDSTEYSADADEAEHALAKKRAKTDSAASTPKKPRANAKTTTTFLLHDCAAQTDTEDVIKLLDSYGLREVKNVADGDNKTLVVVDADSALVSSLAADFDIVEYLWLGYHIVTIDDVLDSKSKRQLLDTCGWQTPASFEPALRFKEFAMRKLYETDGWKSNSAITRSKRWITHTESSDVRVPEDRVHVNATVSPLKIIEEDFIQNKKSHA